MMQSHHTRMPAGAVPRNAKAYTRVMRRGGKVDHFARKQEPFAEPLHTVSLARSACSARFANTLKVLTKARRIAGASL